MTVAHEREIGPAARRGGFQPVHLPPRDDQDGDGRPRPVLALELGARMSWVLWWDEDHWRSGVEGFSCGRRRESRGMQVLRFRSWLREILGLSQPVLVLYTVKSPAGTVSGCMAHNLEGVLLTELEGRVEYFAARSREEGRP